MAEDETPPSTTEPEPVEEREENVEQQSLESRTIIRQRTAEQVKRSIVFLSVNLEFVAGIYAYLGIRSRNLSRKAKAIRIFPMFLIPALATFLCSLFSDFARMPNLRDSRLLQRLRGVSIEEISPNDQQIEDHDVITPVVIVQEPPSASGQVELLSSQNSGTVTPVTVPEMPSGLSIEEMTPNQEMTDPEMEPPVMIIRESPSAGAPVMGDSSFITPLMVQEMGSGLSIEEVNSNHLLIDGREMNTPVMFVQESPSLGSQELSTSTPDPAAATAVAVPEMAGFSVEELSPNQRGNEDSQADPPVMIGQESPSVGGSSTVTPLEVPEPLDDTIDPDGSVRSPNGSVSSSALGSSTITGSSCTLFLDLTEIDQEEIYENDVPGTSYNESLDADGPRGSSVTGPEMPGFFIEEPSLGGPAAATPLEVPELPDDTINPVAMPQHILPPDYALFLSQAVHPVVYASEEELYDRLCHHPLLINGGSMSFGLDEPSGIKCFMISARALSIAWIDNSSYWKWTALPDSRFSECAELNEVCWLDICGRIDSRILTPNTAYAAYLVFKLANKEQGLDNPPQTTEITLAGDTVSQHLVSLWDWPLPGEETEEMIEDVRFPSERSDGWMEVELGEFDSGDGVDGEVNMSFREISDDHWKIGLIVQGIEVKPKH